MRANFKNRKILNSVKITYEITGLNQDRLISELKKRDFTLYNVKKLSNRVMYISVNLSESKNFFAITKNLCYNIKKVRLLGKGKTAYKLLKNFGLALGALTFLALSILSNDFILAVDYSGSGSVYKREVAEYLSARGIDKYTRFSSFETAKLEDDILAENPNLTFVSVEKKGNVLSVYMTVKNQAQLTAGEKQTEFRSTCSGRVESIKVYRGTAVVSVGQTVSVGDLLVAGFVDIKEQRVETGVLASITIIETKSFSYRLEGVDKKEIALALAEQEIDREVQNSWVVVKEISGRPNQFEYIVSLEYRSVLYAG